MPASITVKNGDVFTGVFFGATMENHQSAYLMKMVEQVKSGAKAEPNGTQDCSGGFIGRGDDFAMSFDTKEVTDLAVEGITFDSQHKMQNGGSLLILDLHGGSADTHNRLYYGLPYRY